MAAPTSSVHRRPDGLAAVLRLVYQQLQAFRVGEALDAEAKLRQLEEIEGTVLMVESVGAEGYTDPSIDEVKAEIEQKKTAIRRLLLSPETEVVDPAAVGDMSTVDDVPAPRQSQPPETPEVSRRGRFGEESADRDDGHVPLVDICRISMRVGLRKLDPALASMKPLCDMLNAMYVDEFVDLNVTRHLLAHMSVAIQELQLRKDLVDQLMAVVDAKRHKILQLEVAAERGSSAPSR